MEVIQVLFLGMLFGWIADVWERVNCDFIRQQGEERRRIWLQESEERSLILAQRAKEEHRQSVVRQKEARDKLNAWAVARGDLPHEGLMSTKL